MSSITSVRCPERPPSGGLNMLARRDTAVAPELAYDPAELTLRGEPDG